MTPSEYQAAAKRTENNYHKVRDRLTFEKESNPNAPHTFFKLNHALIGLTGEVGELAGAVEKWAYYGQTLDTDNVKEEIGDCLWYLALACSAVGADMGQVMEQNIAKLQARYPDQYSDERAAEHNRDRNKEKEAAVVRAPCRVCKDDGYYFDNAGEVVLCEECCKPAVK